MTGTVCNPRRCDLCDHASRCADPLRAPRGILTALAIALVLWAIPFGALWLWLAYWR